jgi:hypothetical protein
MEGSTKAYKIVVGKPDGKKIFETPRQRWVEKGKVVPALN